MNMDEKKIPESPLPEHSELPSQETLTDEELAQVARGRIELDSGNCIHCGTRGQYGSPCPNPDCPSNKK